MSEVLVLSIGGDQELATFTEEIGRHCGAEWYGHSVATETEARAILQERTPEIVLTDAASLEQDDFEILKYLRAELPTVVRYAVTDVADRSNMFRLMDEVHQVIAKPWDPAVLARQLQNALSLRHILADEKLRARVAGIKNLPCLPETYSKLVTALRDKKASTKRIAELISADAAVTAKLLQVVNSAYFGVSRRVEDVLHAVGMVGLDTVQNLVLSAGVFEQFQGGGIPPATLEGIYRTSSSVGARSRLLAHSFGLHKRAVDDSLLGGTLHDIGQLLMIKCFPDEFKQALDIADQRNVRMYEAEQEALGVNGASLGAYLLSLWGMSNSIVEAVALHCQPSQCASPVLGPLAVVHLAWAIDSDEQCRIKDEQDSSVDAEYLSALGLADQVPALRGFCAGATA